MSRVLRIPAFRRLLLAYTLNELAWSIGSLSLALLVYHHTGSAVGATAYFLAAQFVPALIAPMMVARLDQRAVRGVLPVLYAGEAVAFLLLAWLASNFALAPLLVLTVADGVLAITARPLARATTVGVTAPRGLLREGNALINASFSICYMAGPAIGALVVVAGGTAAALIVNSCLFAAVTVAMATARGFPAVSRQPGASSQRLRAALRVARARPGVQALLLVQLVAVMTFSIGIPVEVVFVQHSLRAGAGGYGALLSAWGAGAVVGSLVYVRWRAVPSRRLIVLGAVSIGAGMLIMASAPTLAVAIIGAILAGLANGIESVALKTALQERVEQGWMALIMSLSDSIGQAVPGVGILVGGAIAALAGPRPALAVAGVGALGVAVVAWVALRAQDDPVLVVARPDAPGARPDAPGARPDAPGARPDAPGMSPDAPGMSPAPASEARPQGHEVPLPAPRASTVARR